MSIDLERNSQYLKGKKMKPALIYLFFLLLLPLLSPGQKVYVVDSLTKTVKGQLPFDEPFILKVQDKHQSIEKVLLYRLYYKKGELTDEKNPLIQIKPQTIEPFYQKEARHFENYAFLDIEALPPDLTLEVRLIHKFRKAPLMELYGVFNEFKSGEDDKAYKKLNVLLTKLQPTFKDVPVTSFGSTWITDANREVGQLNLSPEVRGQELLKAYHKAIKDFYSANIAPAFNSLYSATFSPAVSHLNKSNLAILEKDAAVSKLSPELVALLWSLLDAGKLQGVYLGSYGPINSAGVQPAKIYELEKRIGNLSSSLKYFNELRAMADWLQLRDNVNTSVYTGLLTDLRAIIVQLTSNRMFLSDLNDQLMEKLDSSDQIRYTTWFSGTNEVLSLKTRGTYFIIPEIGLVSIFANGTNTDQLFVRPTFGVSFYLRQVNKEIPYKHLKNQFLHRFSFSLALSAIEITDDQYSDFYSKMSLLGGANYKLTRSLSFTTGMALLNKKNPIPLIIDNDLVLRYYAGISLDVDFGAQLSKLTGKFGL